MEKDRWDLYKALISGLVIISDSGVRSRDIIATLKTDWGRDKAIKEILDE